MGAEIIASVAETSLAYLKASPRRITPPFAPSPFTPVLEQMYLPSPERIATTIREMLENRA